MVHLPFRRDRFEHRADLSPPSHCTFSSRTLYTVPEHETETFAGTEPVQHHYSSSPSSPSSGHQNRFLNMRDSSHSLTPSQAHQPRAWFGCALQKPENQISWRRRAHPWTTSSQLALHIISFAASIATVTLLAQALISHQKLRHIRQFSGADNAWPKHMSLTAGIILLAAASANVVKSASFFVVEVYCRTRPHSNKLLVVSTACSLSMAAFWISASVFAEINRQNDENFATWACARSDAAFNQVVPYRAICNEEVKLTILPMSFQTVADTNADRRLSACCSSPCHRNGTCHELCRTGHSEQIPSSEIMKSGGEMEKWSID